MSPMDDDREHEDVLYERFGKGDDRVNSLRAQLAAVERERDEQKAWIAVAVESNKAIDAFCREVFPDLPEHCGMPVDGVRKAFLAAKDERDSAHELLEQIAASLDIDIHADPITAIFGLHERMESAAAAKEQAETALAGAVAWIEMLIDGTEDLFDKHGWPPHKNDGGFYLNAARKFIASLPETAKRVAEVVEAAWNVDETARRTDNHVEWIEAVGKLMVALSALPSAPKGEAGDE